MRVRLAFSPEAGAGATRRGQDGRRRAGARRRQLWPTPQADRSAACLPTRPPTGFGIPTGSTRCAGWDCSTRPPSRCSTASPGWFGNCSTCRSRSSPWSRTTASSSSAPMASRSRGPRGGKRRSRIPSASMSSPAARSCGSRTRRGTSWSARTWPGPSWAWPPISARRSGPASSCSDPCCAIDTEPRTWTEAEEAALIDLAELAASELALRHLNAELETRIRDETAARLATEERLSQTRRLEALGQLAGGIAHDFANVLQAVGRRRPPRQQVARSRPRGRAPPARGGGRRRPARRLHHPPPARLRPPRRAPGRARRSARGPHGARRRAEAHPAAARHGDPGRSRAGRRAGPDRPRRAGGGAGQPRDQRARRHAERWLADALGGDHRGRPGAAAARPQARPLRRPRGGGHRHRHGRGNPGPRLRAVLHHQTGRRGHRSRPGHGARLRRRRRRRDRDPQRGRKRHHRHLDPARRTRAGAG